MEEIKENVEHDLAYYESGIRQLYMKHYQKYLLFLLVIMLFTVFGIGLSELFTRWLFVLLFLAEIGLVVYVLRFIRTEVFDAYFQRIKGQLPDEMLKMQLIEVQEDNHSYYFLDNQALYVKLKKKNSRNFPSKIRQYTLLVGYKDGLDEKILEQPLQFFYYDITQIKHSANYKQERLKNADFIAKQRKRRLTSAAVTIFLLILFGLAYLGTL